MHSLDKSYVVCQFLLSLIVKCYSFYIHHSIFTEGDHSSWRLDVSPNIDSSIYPLLSQFKLLKIQPYKKVHPISPVVILAFCMMQIEPLETLLFVGLCCIDTCLVFLLHPGWIHPRRTWFPKAPFEYWSMFFILFFFICIDLNCLNIESFVDYLLGGLPILHLLHMIFFMYGDY